MNNALSMLALGQMQAVKESIKFDETYLVELPNKEVVTLGDLTNFWVKGHQKVKKALEIIKESKEKVECKSKEKAKLQSEQGVERIQTSEECGAEGDRPNNEKEVVQGSESASQKPKRSRVRKSRK